MQQQHEHTLVTLSQPAHRRRRGPRSPFDTSPRRHVARHAHLPMRPSLPPACTSCCRLLHPKGPRPHTLRTFINGLALWKHCGSTVEATICGYTIDHSAQAFCGLRTGCRHHGWLNGWHGPSAQHGAQGVAAGCESDSQALRRVLRGHRVGHPTCLIRSRCQSKLGRRRLHSSFLCGRRLHNSERQRLRHVVRRR